jgi:cytochrome c peroxidase
MPNGFGQQLHLTATEVNSVIAFLRTLSGTAVYTDERWSNPFPN